MVTESILIEWFDRYVKPAPSKLWISAVASDVVQGKPRLLQELLQRGLEKPDALARRCGSARYGACLIAQVLEDLQLEPDELNTILVDLDFLRYPDTLLEKSIPGSIREPLEKLIQKGYDPTSDWEKRLSSAMRMFETELSRLRTLFEIESSSIAPITITSFFAEEGSWWGTTRHLVEGLINILPQFLFISPLASGLLLREGIRHILPSTFQEARDAQEFANIIASQLLPEKDRPTWHRLRWGGKTPSPKEMDNLKTIPQLVEKLQKKNSLPTLLQRLENVNQIALSVPKRSLSRLTILEIKEGSTTPLLKQSHQKVLIHLSENPDLSERQLSIHTQLSRGAIRRSLTWLQDQMNLQVIGEINYHRIGLTPSLLLFNPQPSNHTPKNNQNAIQTRFESFPFCMYLLSPLTSMGTGIVAIFTIPEKISSLFHQKATKWSIQTSANMILANINRFEWGWNFHWWQQFTIDEWQILSQSRLRETPSPKRLTKEITYEGKVVKLTPEILRALYVLEKDVRVSARQLAKNASISLTTAGNYLKKFISTLLVPRIHMTPNQLCETIIFLISAPTINHLVEVTKLLRLLPQYQCWHLQPPIIQGRLKRTTPSLLCAASLPKGGLVPFATSLPDILKTKGVSLTSPHFISPSLPHRIRELPISLFDPSMKEWVCPSKILEELFKLN
ncbi:MAG: hypothetical protein ACFFDP_12515 [Promethearchaeota archaeon]